MNPPDDLNPIEPPVQPVADAELAAPVLEPATVTAPEEATEEAPASLSVGASAKGLPTTLTAARDAQEFVAHMFADEKVDPQAHSVNPIAKILGDSVQAEAVEQADPQSAGDALASMEGKNVLILGLGLSGLAMARWCVRCKAAQVTVADTRVAPPQLAVLQRELEQVQFVSGAFDAQLVQGKNLHALYCSPGLSPAQVEAVVSAAKAENIQLGGELSLYAEALQALRSAQGYAPQVLAITGTNGKTTVTSLTGQLMAHAGKTVAVAGNIGPTLLDTLGGHIDANTLPQVWVLELSSFQLDGVQTFEPSAAVVLNVTQDHLDWHGDMQAYARAKARIFGSQGIMVLNRDDAQVMAMLPEPTRVKLQRPTQRAYITFGTNMPQRPGDFGLEEVNGMVWLVRALEADETRKKRRDEEEELHIQRLMPADALRIRGRHNASNALAALALCAASDCSLGPVLYGLREYRGEPHRVQAIGILNGVEFFDDSKGTNVGATVAALRGLGQDRKVVIILGGEGKGQDFAPLAEPVARHARAAVFIGRDAGLISQALAHTQVPLLSASSMQVAVQLAVQQAQSGDAVLLSPACASFDMFDNYEHRAQVFCEEVKAVAALSGVELEGQP